MGNEAGKAKLMGAQSAYQAQAGGSAAPSSAQMESKGFELKAGSNGRSSGPALPISKMPPAVPSLDPECEDDGDEASEE